MKTKIYVITESSSMHPMDRINPSTIVGAYAEKKSADERLDTIKGLIEEKGGIWKDCRGIPRAGKILADVMGEVNGYYCREVTAETPYGGLQIYRLTETTLQL